MIGRLFWALLGLGLGIVLGIRLTRQVTRVTESARPNAVAERAGRRVGGTQSRLQRAVAVGRATARERERELRDRYGVPTLADLAAPGPPGRAGPVDEGPGTDATGSAADARDAR